MDCPGFRFYPTEEELVSFYLQSKLFDESRTDLDRVIPVLNIYGFSPWDLPRYAGELCQEDVEQWFFFIPRPDREARGGRPNRLTSSGHWKATGSPGYVYSSNDNRVIGVKRSMIFYTGRAPNGTKTDWKMNEYKAVADTTNQPPTTFSSSSTSSTTSTLQLREEMSLCRVYKSSKTLRSFDRRPCGVETTGEGGTSVKAITTSTVSADRNQNQNQNQNMMTTTMRLSPADDHDHSSSSGSHSNHNNEAGPSNYVNTDYMQDSHDLF